MLLGKTNRSLVYCVLALFLSGCNEPDSQNHASDSSPSTSSDTSSDTIGSSSDTIGSSSDTIGSSSDTIGSSSDSDQKSTDSDTASDEDAPAIWGWISAIEWNDTCDQWYLKTEWLGGVRAYFAEMSSYPRALPHTLDFIPEVASEGSCTLYHAGLIADCDQPSDCFKCLDMDFECHFASGIQWCDQDQQCQKEIGTRDGVCEDLPRHFNLGEITLTGFKEQLTLKADEYDRYGVVNIANPDDLFDDGEALTASVEGGRFPSFSFSAKGVAPLELTLAEQNITLSSGEAAEVRWMPADADSRVQVALMSGSHDPNPLAAAIICDVPDSEGHVEIPAAIVDGFLAETCNEAHMKCSRITRYTRDVKAFKEKEVEFFIGSARNLQFWPQWSH